MSGRQLPGVAKEGAWGWDKPIYEELIDRFGPRRLGDEAAAPRRRQLAREPPLPARPADIERLDSHRVTRQPHFARSLAPIEERERVDPVDSFQNCRAPLLPSMYQHLSVGPRHEPVPETFQLPTDLQV